MLSQRGSDLRVEFTALPEKTLQLPDTLETPEASPEYE